MYPSKKEVCGDRIVYLDGVQDPGNVGTIIRTALAFNYDAVILSEDSASIYNDKVISSTKGALFMMNIVSCSLEELKEKGYQLIVTSLGKSVDYKSISVSNKACIVLGSEGQGVKQSTLDMSDVIVRIDISNIDSLNVGVAAGILLNEYRKEK
jgi:TrmH family RNA methyltransferase